MAEERFVGVLRVSLSGAADGWDDECFALLKPPSYDARMRLADFNPLATPTPESLKQSLAFERDFIREHFLSGKVKVLRDGVLVLDDMTVDDAVCAKNITDILMTTLLGIDLDPKAVRKAIAMTTLQIDNETHSETTSLETSQTALSSQTTSGSNASDMPKS